MERPAVLCFVFALLKKVWLLIHPEKDYLIHPGLSCHFSPDNETQDKATQTELWLL